MAVSDKQHLLRQLPAVGILLDDPASQSLIAEFSRSRLAEALQDVVSGWRQRILAGEDLEPSADRVRAEARYLLARLSANRLVRVVNATGVVLNTNLGRAPLPPEALAHAADVGAAYCNLEFDLAVGERGERYWHLEDVLVRLCGAEAAIAVNNNAAAVLLVVDTLARGKEVVVSRGELIEIGGSFRIPDVITASGAELREVGTTNKTHLADFDRALGDKTGLILKCHHSNFKLVGFTQEVSGSELAELAHRHGLPAVEDLGSGTLVDLSAFGLPHEPTVPEAVAAGLDLVTFSGDKLLGGPQAGIVVGKRAYVDRLKKNPLLRALRLDKTSIAMLEATLRLYLDPDRLAVPALQLLAARAEDLRPRAERLAERIAALGLPAVATPATSMPGGGSLPGVELPTWAVRLAPLSSSAQALADRLRAATVPVIGRLSGDALLLDVRTLLSGDDDRILAAVGELFSAAPAAGVQRQGGA